MIFAWLGAVLIGLSLGLLGSGGSILTVPVLVYLVGEPAKLAITESLAIVGAISAIGLLPHARAGRIAWRSVLVFGLPGVVGTALGTTLSHFVPGVVQLSIFAVVMLLAAIFMLRPPVTCRVPEVPRSGLAGILPVALQGLGVGVLTGLVGVGGGFLIIPALVFLGGLPIELAVGTSLVIITLNSATGFLKHALAGETHLHWALIGTFAVIGILGSALGARIGTRVSGPALRRGFGVFLVVMGAYVLATNVPRVLSPPLAAHASLPPAHDRP
ncbi:hypothetical protein HNQ07_004531 [Deinococcus metalli]|uniref:Probable membrane transporter protein n=1 Tax=Deinococcus metalli TaxID=1141878 RepID=A0A7W8KL63_9DEIO|nr:sulfite exporter TauE/SafE family protein [Deinococcus metalli]MBB5379021.1 hypothetical protein [Deinococcus metalli]GHF63290.1 UPF0721 transmembrane protein [Deinococcus metalli]